MTDIEKLQLVLSAISDAFIVSQTQAYHTEIVDGGTKNKIWSFTTALALTPAVLEPLAQLWPDMYLGLYQCGFTAFSAGVYYIASVAHQNQIYINQGELDKIQALPFHAHNNKFLMDSTLFLSRNMNKFLIPFYVASLVSCIFFGAPVYGYISLIMYGVNLLNQYGYFPAILKTPYLYLNVLVMTSATFGLTSWLNMAFFLAGVTYVIVDYIRCHLYQADSPTAQFPMADPEKKFTVLAIANNDANAEEQLSSLINKHRTYKSLCATKPAQLRFGFPWESFLYAFSRMSGYNSEQVYNGAQKVLFHEKITPDGVHVTFNHFYDSHQLVETILADAPPIDYEDYFALFNQCDFKSPAFRDTIASQMLLHDKYHEKAFADRCAEFGLSHQAELVDVQIAYLRREMTYFVQRFNNPSYRDLTAQQVAVMHRYVRLLLPKIKQLPVARQNDIILTIAICTGSHCNRIYLETLSSLAEEFGCLVNDTLTFREQAMLEVQAVREAAFRRYYYHAAKLLKNKNPVFKKIFEDLDDYHTYELFVKLFGANFYLRNPTLTLRYRTTQEIYRDKTVHMSLSRLHFTDEKMLFSQTYNAAYLVDQVLRPESKLHTVFIRWCREHFPSGYENIVYDDDHWLKNGPQIKALAELMLLDLGILELNDAYPLGDVSIPEVATLRLAIVVREEVTNYLKARENPQDAASFIHVSHLVHEIRTTGVNAIWELVKDRITTRLFEEFDMLYPNIDNSDFINFIDAGRQVEYHSLSLHKLYDSEGYRQYLENMDKQIAAIGRELEEKEQNIANLQANSIFKTKDDVIAEDNDYATAPHSGELASAVL